MRPIYKRNTTTEVTPRYLLGLRTCRKCEGSGFDERGIYACDRCNGYTVEGYHHDRLGDLRFKRMYRRSEPKTYQRFRARLFKPVKLPDYRDQHREALASIPTPVAPDDRL